MSPIVAPMSMTLLPTRVWTQEQWNRIKRGYRARGMDEKWDVYVEGHVAFLHRSWTGRGVFEASFSPIDAGWHISAAVAESNTKRVRNVSVQLNKVLLELVLSAIVLGEPTADLRVAAPARARAGRAPRRPVPPQRAGQTDMHPSP